jgi:hypothetical protein
MAKKNPTVTEVLDLVRAAAVESAEFQERHAAEDIESRKIVSIMEDFLRGKGRVAYGGSAINAQLPPEKRFYDPRVNLPDYDFMTPDPLQDCADLIVAFQEEGFTEVEAQFGIHEGTYKIFVSYRSAADITYMPPEIYERVLRDSTKIEGINYASPNFLRMNMYLELSRPAGMISRWEKVYERLMLLNEAHPIRAGHCTEDPLGSLGAKEEGSDPILHEQIVADGIKAGAIFLSGASYLVDREPRTDEVVLLLTDKPAALVTTLKGRELKATAHDAMGELLPARTELRTKRGRLVAVVFETVACHSYTTLTDPVGYRLASIYTMLQLYYAMYFVDLRGYIPVRLLCVIQDLVDLEVERRNRGIVKGEAPHEVIPLDCVGHQPTMPELKRAHRARVREKKKELAVALRFKASVRVTRKQKRRSKNNRLSSRHRDA